ncbi:HET domain-containing protein [Colletotrichum scovillei]|uniref:HET domain-containing protein n=1 Tax=Colletotrichum scovillei TaxID=1209932 RepID=A0A9P7RJZ5_9PEZI|nr:HET domain-containing protein [Colletotrichum scovillei]KAG7078146.1 HET domain-containing protein [Colletotrichum scovillei]KAG7085257.1 HET domain-containing protein [Colletotrichum scovillei]
MRLINTATLELEEFIDHTRTPPYAILSHAWQDGEVSFQEWNHRETRIGKKGFLKVESFCRLTSQDGYTHAWVDTNCIDKRSSAELSEAINSMFAWYREAAFCYVYMADVSISGTTIDQRDLEIQFLNSKWFTRGWTLQELIAPRRIRFFAQDWGFIGTKQSLFEAIHQATGIDKKCLLGITFSSEFSIAKVMSWAADRVTTRLEDQAYCLLGLLNVNMPLLYGEGGKAFFRLQEEIIRVSDDQSIFVCDIPALSMTAPLANSPALFADSLDVGRRPRPIAPMDTMPQLHTMTHAGLSISLPLIQTLSPQFVLGVLNCRTLQGSIDNCICLPLSSHFSRYRQQYTRVSLPGPWISLSFSSVESFLPWHGENAARACGWRSDLTPEESTNIMISMLRPLEREHLSMHIFEPVKRMAGGSARAFCFVTFPCGLFGHRLYASDPPETVDQQNSMMVMLGQDVFDEKGRGLLVFRAKGPAYDTGRYTGIYLEAALKNDGALQDWPRACRVLQNCKLGWKYDGNDEDRGTSQTCLHSINESRVSGGNRLRHG